MAWADIQVTKETSEGGLPKGGRIVVYLDAAEATEMMIRYEEDKKRWREYIKKLLDPELVADLLEKEALIDWL